MREIKFRGLTKEGKWVYGNLINKMKTLTLIKILKFVSFLMILISFQIMGYFNELCLKVLFGIFGVFGLFMFEHSIREQLKEGKE